MSLILVVDDNAASRRLVCDVLHHRGHELLEAASAGEGLALLHQCVPDLVLLDVRIPGGGGETLLREIRSDTRFISIPVVAVTAQATCGDRERLFAAGFNSYVSKPINAWAFGPDVESLI